MWVPNSESSGNNAEKDCLLNNSPPRDATILYLALQKAFSTNDRPCEPVVLKVQRRRVLHTRNKLAFWRYSQGA